jgi:hypothetical protein
MRWERFGDSLSTRPDRSGPQGASQSRRSVLASGHRPRGVAQVGFAEVRCEREIQMSNTSSSTMPKAIISTAKATES